MRVEASGPAGAAGREGEDRATKAKCEGRGRGPDGEGGGRGWQ